MRSDMKRSVTGRLVPRPYSPVEAIQCGINLHRGCLGLDVPDCEAWVWLLQRAKLVDPHSMQKRQLMHQCHSDTQASTGLNSIGHRPYHRSEPTECPDQDIRAKGE